MSITILEQLKKTIIFLGEVYEEDGGFRNHILFATGFLVDIEEITHLVTAKHVVMNQSNNRINKNLQVYFNKKGGGAEFLPISEIIRKFKVKWMFHKDENVDNAIIPFGSDPKTADILCITKEYFAKKDELNELSNVFYLSFQPGIPMLTKILPFVRAGVISLINPDDGIIYIDGFAFPGNSGSPVFIKTLPFKLKGK